MKLQDLTVEEQREVAQKLLGKKYGSMAETHAELSKRYGVSTAVLYKWAKKLKENRVIDFETSSFIKSRSTLLDADGMVKLQWVKEDREATDKLEAFNLAIESILDRVVAKEAVEVPTHTVADMMTVYTIGDAHIGMMAWDKETGADHDIKIAEADLLKAMSMLVKQANDTERCLIVDVGDYFHSDNMDNRTAKSGNSLDVDGRYPKVLETGLRITTELIDMALAKHGVVEWRSAIGNHNTHSSIMINAFVKAYYRNEPRVVVHDTPNMFMYYTFGKNLIGITHGDTVKADRLGEVMAVDCAKVWSDSEYRYWYTGHVHHQSVKEYASCVVETFRTLAGKDAWHSASGYRSGQDMKAITLHKEYGEIARNTVGIRQVRGK